jgi:AAA domain/IclR helix-turn-helix domain
VDQAQLTHDGEIGSQIFHITTPAKRNSNAAQMLEPVYLSDEFWIDGEIALLFGETGKSTLSVQIAESIACGRPFTTEKMTASPQKVLYIDTDFSEAQFERRYFDPIPDGTDTVPKPYEFSENFIRVELHQTPVVRGIKSAAQIGSELEALVLKTGAKVLIIDNISAFRASSGSSTGDLLLIRELIGLKRRLGLSILAVHNHEVRPHNRGLSVRDLGPAAILANFVDSVFAMGKSGDQGPYRYIKHLRSRSIEVTYNADNTVTFVRTYIDGNFPGFEFEQFDHESRQQEYGDGIHRKNLVEAFECRDEGMTIREIADHMELSKSKVHRLLQMERPRSAGPKDEKPADPTPAPKKPEPKFEFPKERYEGEFTDRYLARSGLKPRWWNALKQSVEGGLHFEPDAVYCVAPDPSALADAPANTNAADQQSHLPQWQRGKTRSIDGYGQEIFVEKFDERGKPMIYYKQERKTVLKRTAGSAGIEVERVESAEKAQNLMEKPPAAGPAEIIDK